MDLIELIKNNKLFNNIIEGVNRFRNSNQSYEDLRYDYLKALENPDNVGYIPIIGIWVPPTDKVKYDTNQIGIGLDMKYNKDVSRFLQETGRTNKPYLTNQEMRDLQNKSLKYYEDILDKYTKGINLSDTKRAIAIGLIYHGHGPKLWNPTTAKQQRMSNALFKGTDQEFIDTVSDFYSENTRSQRHSSYWNKDE